MEITIKELIGVDIKELKTGSELLLMHEFYKYTKQILGKELTIKDIKVDPEVRQGEHFAYVYKNSDIDIQYNPCKNEKLADYSETERKYFKGDVRNIVYEKQTKEEWVYSYHTDKSANIVLNRYDRSAGYVSLYAYMVVKSYQERKKTPKLVLKNLSYKQEEQEYVDMLILRDYGNRLLKGKIEIQFSREVVVQPEWEAFIMYNRQKGYMLKESNIREKRDYMKKEIEIGDIVLYYKTDKTIKSKTIRKLISCYPAVVREIGEQNITIEYYSLVENYLTHKIKLDEAEKNAKEAGVEGFTYTQSDYEVFPTATVVLDYVGTGIDKLFYTEDNFILKLIEGNDEFTVYLKDKKGKVNEVKMGTIDLIYTVFEDRGVDYNRDRFLKKHYPRNRKPMYDKIKGQSKKRKRK